MKVLVPVTAWNFLSNTVAVRDCVTRLSVSVPRADTRLVGGAAVCIEAESLAEVGGRHKVRLANGLTAWVRPLGTPDDDASEN